MDVACVTCNRWTRFQSFVDRFKVEIPTCQLLVFIEINRRDVSLYRDIYVSWLPVYCKTKPINTNMTK